MMTYFLNFTLNAAQFNRWLNIPSVGAPGLVVRPKYPERNYEFAILTEFKILHLLATVLEFGLMQRCCLGEHR